MLKYFVSIVPEAVTDPFVQEKSRRSSFGVTLEPEWDILDVDDATSLSGILPQIIEVAHGGL